MSEKKKKLPKKTSYEKPVSLAGAPFNEVIGALLKTPKLEKKRGKERNERR